MPIAFAKGRRFKILFMTFFLHSVALFIVTLVTSTWSFEVNERTQEILKLVTHQFNENVRLQERVPSPEIRHPDCVPVSSRRGWQSYLQYPFILWDPLAQFPHLFDTRSLLCPLCLGDSEKAALETTSLLKRTNHWFNGRLKRFNPRIVFHTNTCVLLVSCMYRCCKGHEISSCHSSVLSNFPVSYTFQLPFCLFHKSGFTKDALLLVQKLVDEGLAFNQIERLFESQYRDCFSSMECKFWCDYPLENHQGDQDIMKELRFFPSFSNNNFPHPSNDLLIDLYVAGCKMQEVKFAQAMSRQPARWISCDHTFKSVANIGYKRSSDGKWIRLYNSVFCILNENGNVIQWQFTKSENFNEVSKMFADLRERFQVQNSRLEGIMIDNCCKWKESLRRVFPGIPVKLDLFHAVQRFVKTISKRNPYHRAISKDYGLIFRDPKDLGEKRTMPTPEPSVILHNLDQFLSKWKGFAHDDKQLITQKGQKALKNIKSHILKGCLSNIPVGCCTSVQERMHREMKKILSSNRIGSELAYSKFSRFFFQHNARKSEGGLWSPIMEEAKVRRLHATGRSLEAKEAYVETFGIREKSAAQTTEGKDSSPKAISLKELTCDQISVILDEIKFSIEEQSDLDDHREHENDHTDASTSPRDNSVGLILRILQYGLSLFKVMLYFQKMQGVQAVSFLKLPFMSRALIHARSLLETSEKNSDISARVSSFGYNVEPVPGDGNCFFHAVSFQLLKLMSGENGRSTQERLLNLGISPNQSMASIAAVLRQRIVDEWQGPFVDEYQQFFQDSELDVYTEAENFRQSGEFSRPLGDAMPLAMANILQMPIVLITSAQNMPIVTITPRRIADEVSVVLAYTQRGVGHYDAVTQNNIAKVGGDSPDNDSAKMIKESCKGICHHQLHITMVSRLMLQVPYNWECSSNNPIGNIEPLNHRNALYIVVTFVAVFTCLAVQKYFYLDPR